MMEIYIMMGGIIVGTLLTLLFLPALYVAWFRIKQPHTPELGDTSDTTRENSVLIPSELA